MPGCLGLDALWQLTGFFLGWLGLPGRGRALGVGEVKFTDRSCPTRQESRLRRRHQARVQGQAHSRHRRRLAGSRRPAHLRSEGHAGRTVSQAAPAASLKLSADELEDLAGETYETRRRHRHGHRFLDRQQYAGSAAPACARRAPASSRAEKYAELGFRCQVHGAPTLKPEDDRRPPRDALSWRRHRLEPCRHGSGDPRRRPRARTRSPTSAPA